jgi:hypothetical protein
VNDVWKAIGIGAICCVISFGAGYVLSYTTKYTNNDSEYAVRLANAERINRELQSANIRLGDLNTSLTEQLSIISGKLARAKTVIGRIQSQLGTDGDTVQRLVETLSGLEQALQIIFAGS